LSQLTSGGNVPGEGYESASAATTAHDPQTGLVTSKLARTEPRMEFVLDDKYEWVRRWSFEHEIGAAEVSTLVVVQGPFEVTRHGPGKATHRSKRTATCGTVASCLVYDGSCESVSKSLVCPRDRADSAGHLGLVPPITKSNH
jgi:hypothetical protein